MSTIFEWIAARSIISTFRRAGRYNFQHRPRRVVASGTWSSSTSGMLYYPVDRSLVFRADDLLQLFRTHGTFRDFLRLGLIGWCGGKFEDFAAIHWYKSWHRRSTLLREWAGSGTIPARKSPPVDRTTASEFTNDAPPAAVFGGFQPNISFKADALTSLSRLHPSTTILFVLSGHRYNIEAVS